MVKRQQEGEDLAEFNCSKCKQNTPHTKKNLIIKAPEVLILPLVRFNDDRTKNKTPISFEMELKLNNFFSTQLKNEMKNFKYKLVSFVVHDGELDGGHYWAYGKNSDGDWFRYDDMEPGVPNVNDCINQILDSGIDVTHKDKAGTPYVLIYERVSFEEDFKQNLTSMKTRLKELKTKLQALQGKLDALKGKLVH